MPHLNREVKLKKQDILNNFFFHDGVGVANFDPLHTNVFGFSETFETWGYEK